MVASPSSQLDRLETRVIRARKVVVIAMDSRANHLAHLFNEYTQALHEYRLALREYTKGIESDVIR